MWRFLLLLGLLLALPAIAGAQAGSCELLESQSVTQTTSNGVAVISVRGPLLVRCAGGAELRANEANIYQATSEVHLFGNVDFRDPERALTSNNAIYSSVTRRLLATGDVVYTDLTSGSTLRGPEIEYYRPGPGRPETQVIANQRPHLTLIPQPSADGQPQEPLEIDADRTVIVGETLSASGSVVIERTDLTGRAAEARYERGTGALELQGQARVENERFGLEGETIQGQIPEGGIDYLVARRDAVLTGEELRIAAPEVQLFFADDLLQRLNARRIFADSTRPVVTATGFRLEADSLEALTPSQQLSRVVAVGTARGEAIDTTQAVDPADLLAAALPDSIVTPDSIAVPDSAAVAVGPPLAMDRDWITGDTVTGYFVPVDTTAVAPDSANEKPEAEVRIDRLVARGDARALYRVRRNNATDTIPPGVNYVSGSAIELGFEQGELALGEVNGLNRGLFLDPVVPAAETPTPGETPTETPTEAPAGTPTEGGSETAEPPASPPPATVPPPEEQVP